LVLPANEDEDLDFILAYFLTLVVETGALYLLLRRRYRAKTIILNSIIANSVTLPFVWYFFPALGLDWPVQTAIAELFAFISEAVFYWKAFARLGYKEAALASFTCNLLSLGIGLLLAMHGF
jgi:uncharacterized protein (DUF2062 family)